jgi:hypothetical protein
MRRVIAICIAGAAVIAVVAPSVGANGEPRARTTTLRASSELEHLHAVDNPPAGDSAGDVLIFTEKLLNHDGHVIGHDAATCTRLFDQRSLCTGTYILHRGQLMVQLLQPSLGGTLTYTQAITGGTGKYARATGTVTVHQASSGDRFVFRIHVPRG